MSGLHYVLHLFDSADSVLTASAIGGDAQLSLVRESVRQHDDRMAYLENRHNRLLDVTNLKAAVDAEFNDWVTNRSEEDWFTISGLKRLTQIASSEWQDAVRHQVTKVVKAVLNSNQVCHDFEVVHVVNPFRHQTTGPTTYNVRMNSVAASKLVRDLFSGFFRHNRPVKLPAELKGLSLRNKVTKETKIRIEILRQLGEVYQAANPGSSYRVRGFESRPLLVTFPPQNSNSRQRTYTFIQAATTMGCRFSDEHLAQIYRVVGNSSQGLLRTLFIVLNDDDRDRCIELAKNSTRSRSRQTGWPPQSGQSTSGQRVSFAQSTSGTVHGSGAGVDVDHGTSQVCLEPGFLSSLKSPPPPPPSSESRDKRRRESSASSVDTYRSSKNSRSKSKSSKRSRNRSRSTSGSSDSSRSRSPRKSSKSKSRNKGKSRDRSSSRSRSPSTSRGSRGNDRDKERSDGRSKDRGPDASSKKTK